MRALLGGVFLVVSFSLSSLWVYHVSPFQPEEFLLKNQPVALWKFLCMFYTYKYFLFIFSFRHFDYNVLYISLWSNPIGSFLEFLDFGDCLLPYVREIFSYYLFRYFLRCSLSLFLSLSFSLSLSLPLLGYNVNITPLMLSQKSLKRSSLLFILFSVWQQWYPLFCQS